MTDYPIFLKLNNRRVVVVGGGPVAARKVQALLAAQADVVVVADVIDDMLMTFCNGAKAKLIKSNYSKDYLAGALLVIAATDNHQVNKQIYEDCQELKLLCNVVDEPELCDFFVPAVAKQGDLQIAVSTGGLCPAYAAQIKNRLANIFTEQHGQFLTELGRLRKPVIEHIPEPADRKSLMYALADDNSFEYFIQKGLNQWRQFARELISKKQV